MKKILLAVLIIVGVFTLSFAADVEKTLTFGWNYTPAQGEPALKLWRMQWSAEPGGPYADLADINYADSAGGTWTSPVMAVVTGAPGTTETRYFVLLACGDMPQSDGTTQFKCSVPSNEVSYGFWIEPTGFSAPIQFRVIAE